MHFGLRLRFACSRGLGRSEQEKTYSSVSLIRQGKDLIDIPCRALAVSAFLTLVILGPQPAPSASLTAQQVLSSFNVVTFGNDSATSSDVQGAAIVGGN